MGREGGSVGGHDSYITGQNDDPRPSGTSSYRHRRLARQHPLSLEQAVPDPGGRSSQWLQIEVRHLREVLEVQNRFERGREKTVRARIPSSHLGVSQQQGSPVFGGRTDEVWIREELISQTNTVRHDQSVPHIFTPAQSSSGRMISGETKIPKGCCCHWWRSVRWLHHQRERLQEVG